MTVAELDATMSADELVHWYAFFKLENEDHEAKQKKPARADSEE